MIGTYIRIAAVVALSLSFLPAGVQASEESWTKFEAHLQECTAKHGYDRKRERNLGEHELGTGELAWRECAYDGVRKLLIPASGLDSSYRRVIVQDKVMTDKVAKGDLTRRERAKRLEELVSQLRAAELQRAPQEMDQAHAEFMQRMVELRRMKRLNGIMR